MPAKVYRKSTLRGKAIMASLLIGLVWCCYERPILIPIIGIIPFITWVAGIVDRKRLTRIALERQGEGICEFARSFERRTADPWVIRAVYDALQPYFFGRDQRFPVRATDRLAEDIHTDPEDVNDMACDIAERTGHDMRDTEKNPLYDRVKTVGDMVMFFSHQPRKPDAEPSARPYGSPAAGSPSRQV